MKVLVGKTFGIGNAVMCVPMIKALKSMGHTVDVLVGSLPDDTGAKEVMFMLKDRLSVDTVHIDSVLLTREYDLAIMSIPFDGRWKNGIHFKAKQVIDGRTRPDPSTTGLVSWKKHEIEYQMDTARELGFMGDVPSCEFFVRHATTWERIFYLGIGYKKDAAGFWKAKHWGNENYAKLVKMILDDHPRNKVVTTGDMQDLTLTVAPILRIVNDSRFAYESGNLKRSFDIVSDCEFYVGNDTGMMHVAAAANRNVLGLFFLENSIVKSRPWGKKSYALDGVGRSVSPEEVFSRLKEMTSVG